MTAAEMNALSVVHWLAIHECRTSEPQTRRGGLFILNDGTESLYYPPLPGLARGGWHDAVGAYPSGRSR